MSPAVAPVVLGYCGKECGRDSSKTFRCQRCKDRFCCCQRNDEQPRLCIDCWLARRESPPRWSCKLLDLTDQIFGDLVAVAPVDRGGDFKVPTAWICRCECGGTAVRTTRYLRTALRENAHPACDECNRRLRAMRYSDTHPFVHDRLLQLWADTGSVWSPLATDILEGQTRALVAKETGFVPREVTGATAEIQDPEETRVPHGRGTDMTALVPLSSRFGWDCDECGHWTGTSCFGCSTCMDALCRACVAEGKHKFHAGYTDGCTLEQIGKLLGVTRERVRQIEAKGLRKLQVGKRTQLLREMFFGPSEEPELVITPVLELPPETERKPLPPPVVPPPKPNPHQVASDWLRSEAAAQAVIATLGDYAEFANHPMNVRRAK